MGTRRSVRVYPYSPSKDKVITRALLEGMEGIAYLGSTIKGKIIRLEDSMVYVFELCLEHVEDEDRRRPVICRPYDDFGNLEALNDQINKLRAQIADAETKSQELTTKLQEQQTNFQRIEAAMEKRRHDLDLEYEQKKAEAQGNYEKLAASLEQKVQAMQRIARKQSENILSIIMEWQQEIINGIECARNAMQGGD